TQAAAPIALDSHDTGTLTGLEEIHQSAEAVAAFVEAAVRRAEDLLHVAQVHRPARVRCRGQNARHALHAGVLAPGGDHRRRLGGSGVLLSSAGSGEASVSPPIVSAGRTRGPGGCSGAVPVDDGAARSPAALTAARRTPARFS